MTPKVGTIFTYNIPTQTFLPPLSAPNMKLTLTLIQPEGGLLTNDHWIELKGASMTEGYEGFYRSIPIICYTPGSQPQTDPQIWFVRFN